MGRKGADGGSLQGWAQLHQWVSGYLHEKTTPRKIVQWHHWARKKLESGLSAADVEQRLRHLWGLHSRNHDMRELEPDLLIAVHEVYECADKGWTPSQCAVVYRSLARAFPTRYWLSEKAAAWEAAGDDWKAVVMP